MYVLLHWVNEPNYNIYNMNKILEPRKPFESYEIGDVVKAKFYGRVYSAVIEGIAGKY